MHTLRTVFRRRAHPSVRVARATSLRTCLLAALFAGAWSCGREPTAAGGGGVRERWYQPQFDIARARPAVSGDVVYFGTGDGKVVARDIGTGAPRWTTTVGADGIQGATFVVRSGVVIVPVLYYTVALDASTGRELWRYAAPPDTAYRGVSTSAGVVDFSHPDADAATVYVPAWGASVSALDVHTGAVRWVWQPGRAASDTAIAGRFRSGSMGVRVSGDTVFATAWHFTTVNGIHSEPWLLALDRRTGQELWRVVLPDAAEYHPSGGTCIWGAPALVGTLVIVVDNGGRAYAIDRATQRIVWRFRSPAANLSTPGQAEAYGDAVYLDGGDSNIYALRASDGAVLWKSAFPTQTVSDLLTTERRLIFSTGAYLYVFDRQTGQQLAKVTQPRVSNNNGLFSSPSAEAGGHVFVTMYGAAWSFDEP